MQSTVVVNTSCKQMCVTNAAISYSYEKIQQAQYPVEQTSSQF